MDSWRTLYGYEMKKLLGRRSLWVVLGLCAAILVFSILTGLMGSFYGGGETLGECYEIFTAERKDRETVSGREIDQALLEEMAAAYRKIPPERLREGYEKTEEYLAFAQPYCEIFDLVRAWTGMNLRAAVYWEPKEESLYEARRWMVERYCRALGLSEEQKEFWMEKESRMPAPMRYVCNDGYFMIMAVWPAAGMWMMLVAAVGMSGIFAEERMRGTDRMILACSKGRGSLYWAKFWAGVSLTAACALLMIAVAACSAFCIYGTGGFEAPIQFYFPYYAYPLTMGQACLILCGIFVLTAVLDGIFVMVVSELTGSFKTTLVLSMGIWGIDLAAIIVCVRNPQIPQIWQYMPTTCLWERAIFDMRPAMLLGHCFTLWQTVPAVQLFYGILAALAGRLIYGRHQVRGA